MIVGACLLADATTLATALLVPTGWTLVVAGLLLLASIWVSASDAIGNISVRTSDRR